MGDGSFEEQRGAVRRIVARLSPTGAATAEPEHRLIEDLGYDSLALIELAIALEDEFRLTPLSDYESLDIVRVGEVEELIVGRIASGAVRR